MTARPGPPSIPPGGCPGGVIVHVYDATTGRLVRDRTLTGLGADALHYAAVAGDHDGDTVWGLLDPADPPAVYLAAFDGDTGERMLWPGLAIRSEAT